MNKLIETELEALLTKDSERWAYRKMKTDE